MGRDPASGREALGLTRDEMWTAFSRRDARYDGRFIAGVRSTGIFCRPVCPCRKPRPERVEYFPSPDAALQAGYRACKRCRPELPGGPAEAGRRFAERALAVMRARLDEPLTLSDLAAAVGSSPSAFVRRFRAADGRTPMRALAELRVERAEALLRDTRLNVLEAGLTAGFGSPSAFARAFRRRTGGSPARWRATVRGGADSPPRAGVGRMKPAVRAARLVLALALLVAGLHPAAAEEPVRVAGTWVGTWWMGKYEEPIELELVQDGSTLSGRVAMLGYPGAGPSATDAAVTLTGRLEGERLALAWQVGERRFTAALTLAAPRTLVGLGGEGGRVAVGLELSRVR